MNTSNRNVTRVDRAAVCATFAAALLTLCVSSVAMQPAATPLIAVAEVVALAVDPGAAGEPCPHDGVTAGEAQPAATGRN